MADPDWACIRAEPHDGETMQEVCTRLGLPYDRGCGYYQLIKSEKISAMKELASLRPASRRWIVGGAAVRRALGLPAGAITVKPGDVPAGIELFVQSTSANRKLASNGALLLRLPSNPTTRRAAGLFSPSAGGGGGGPAAAAAAAAAPASATSGRVNASCPPKGKPAKRARTVVVPLIDWDRFTIALEDTVDGFSEGLDEDSLVVRNDGADWICDEAVAQNQVRDIIDWLVLVFQSATDWVSTDVSTFAMPSKYGIGFEPPPLCRYQWTSAGTGARLMYLDMEDATLMAIEVVPAAATVAAVQSKLTPFALVTGNAGSHPLVHAQAFTYANSDGSSSDCDLTGLVTPHVVLAKFIHDTAMHCANKEH